MGGPTDFTVETKGRCFFCLNSINPVKMEPFSSHTYLPSSFHSLQYLSSYLKINMIKVFPDTNSIPFDLQEKVLKSKLKVALCYGCSTINEQFSKVFKELERVNMEATFWLQQILTKFSQVGSKDRTEELNTVFMEDASDKGKLMIAEALREDTLKKCFQKLQNACPRVRIMRMGRKQKAKVMANLKSISEAYDHKRATWLDSQTSVTEASFQDCQPLNIKTEHTNTDWLPDEDDAANNLSDISERYSELNLPVIESIQSVAISIMPSTIPTTNLTVIPSPASSREADVPTKLICNRSTVKYKCGYCNKLFLSRHGRSIHQNSIHLGAKFACPVCNKEFCDKSVLRRHLRETTCRTGKPPEPKVYKHTVHCKLCGTGFVSNTGLHQHLQEAHLQVRNHECKTCGKKFFRRWHLSIHRRKVHKLEN